MAHIRQSRPDSGLGLQIAALTSFKLFLFCSAGYAEEGEGGGGGAAGGGELPSEYGTNKTVKA